MLIIDRFEENFAVVEDTENDTMTKIEREKIEDTAKEGDVIILKEKSENVFEKDRSYISAGGRYRVDSEATEKRRREIAELLKSLDI